MANQEEFDPTEHQDCVIINSGFRCGHNRIVCRTCNKQGPSIPAGNVVDHCHYCCSRFCCMQNIDAAMAKLSKTKGQLQDGQMFVEKAEEEYNSCTETDKAWYYRSLVAYRDEVDKLALFVAEDEDLVEKEKADHMTEHVICMQRGMWRYPVNGAQGS